MTTRLAHLSDLHFGREDGPALEAALAAIDAFAPDLVILTGDLTLAGRRREFRAAAAWIARLGRPVLATPGNHDTPYWNLPLRAVRPFARWRRYIGPADALAYDGQGLAVRTLNSARGAQARADWSKGVINLERLRAIDWGPAGVLKVFACHHPLVDLPGAPATGRVRRGRAAVDALAGAGVDLVLTGHVHAPFAVPLTPGGPWALGAGTLSERTRGEPPSFLLIESGAAETVVDVAAWTGGGFSRARRWALERRSGAG